MELKRVRPAVARREHTSAGQQSDVADDIKNSKPWRKNPGSTFIPIDGRFAIGADRYSWHILQARLYKGACKWEPILWYGSIDQCVNGLRQLAVRTSGAQSLADALSEADRVTAAICQALSASFKVEQRP